MLFCVTSVTASLPPAQLVVWAPLICYRCFTHRKGDLLLYLLIDLLPRNASITQLKCYPGFSVQTCTSWPQSVIFQRGLQTYCRTALCCTSISSVLIDIDSNTYSDAGGGYAPGWLCAEKLVPVLLWSSSWLKDRGVCKMHKGSTEGCGRDCEASAGDTHA